MKERKPFLGRETTGHYINFKVLRSVPVLGTRLVLWWWFCKMLFFGFSDLCWFLGRLFLASQEGGICRDDARVGRFNGFCLTLLTWGLAELETLVSKVINLLSFGVIIFRCLLGFCLTLGLFLVAGLVTLISGWRCLLELGAGVIFFRRLLGVCLTLGFL